MDLLNSTLVLYLMIGAAIGFTMYVSGPGGPWAGRVFRVLTAIVFWPLYVPLLLRGAPAPRGDSDACDELGRAIAQVEAELRTALASVNGEKDVLAQEAARLEEFRSVWRAYAARIREMDCLLQAPENAAGLTRDSTSERWQKSEEARQHNLQSIRRLRERTYHELMGSLTWVRELVSMLHLARFTGAPVARARELLDQIAVAVLSLAEGPLEKGIDVRYRAAGSANPPLAASRSLSGR